jgi:hypothetical protein
MREVKEGVKAPAGPFIVLKFEFVNLRGDVVSEKDEEPYNKSCENEEPEGGIAFHGEVGLG